MKGTRSKDANQTVEIKVVTWAKDSHGLFDYESKTLDYKRFTLDNTTKFFRNPSSNLKCDAASEVEIRTCEESKSQKHPLADLELQPLAEIVRKESTAAEGRFFFKGGPQRDITGHMDIEAPNENPYLIVRSLKNQHGEQKGYALEIGDIIKLGRIEYVVSELKTASETLSNRRITNDAMKVYELNETLEGQCKICLAEEEAEDNFFVSPCSCKGSCSIVHINCLKKWIESKMVVKQHDLAIAYNFTKFECEICKDPYPKIIKRNDVGHELFVLTRPTTPYIMLEGLQQQNKDNKTMYVIRAINPGETIKMGRGHQCEIRITDISVSREHAHIRYDNQRFYIFDNNSKFGTLIGMRNDLPIRSEKVAVQIGRTVITCTLKTEEKESGKNPRSVTAFSGQTLGSRK